MDWGGKRDAYTGRLLDEIELMPDRELVRRDAARWLA